ncbi:MAG: ABC transporter substrate-binding protein [Jatrophihabitans sp.]|uniref:ABC transporter substrate-binding protein n=1 Tax=Jatrophihabitans sp. TaxID=1932789 RepID=UPI003F812338
MRWKISIAALAVATTALSACSSSGSNGGGGGGGSTTPTGGGSSANGGGGGVDTSAVSKNNIKPVTMTGDCADFGKYGKYSGQTVTIYTSITNPELQYHIDSVKQFEKCTGISIQYQGTKDFEGALKTKVQGGNAPDLAFFPQPGLLQKFASGGQLKPATADLLKEAQTNWAPSWIGYGTVDKVFFGAPLGANLKSLIWYSPKYFKQWGYTVPTTWDQLQALTDKAVKDGHKPWCLGIESGDATGWVLTDWMEEFMLRMYGPDVYDQWVSHKIPFNDPKVLDVLKKVGSIVKNPAYVNAGIGDVKSIATTAFQKGGLPIETGKCVFHAQANFYAANWDKGIKVAQDGDVFAFYEPTFNDKFGKVVEVGGEFVGAFSDSAPTQAVQLYLASGDWATRKATLNSQAGTSGWATANKAVDKSVFKDPIDKLSVDILTDPSSNARFDGSDAMPAEVGTGSFWTQMTQWILGNVSDQQALDNIEQSWPK